MRWLVLCLVSSVAAAAPILPHGTHKVGDTLVHIEKPGEGAPPDDADEVTYRWDGFKDRDPAQKEHEEKTRHMLDANDRVREHLATMKPGEVRWIWYAEQDGNLCDHFGCAHGPDDWAAKIELVSVTRHTDVLPDDMHITAWPFLGVQRGATWAELPADQVKSMDSVRLAGETVTIEDGEERFGGPSVVHHVSRSVTLAELRARLADVEGFAALKAKKWKAALALFDKAADLDPALELPALHRVLAQKILNQPVAELAITPELYWRVMYDDGFKSLRKNIEQKGTGVDDVTGYRCAGSCMEIDPQGRYVIAFTTTSLDAEFRLAFGALRVIDLKTRSIVATIPLDDGGSNSSEDGTQHCSKCKKLIAAKKMLEDLGFQPIKSAPVTISQLPYANHQDHWLVVFPTAKLSLARAGDKPAMAEHFIAIDPPDFAKIPDAELFDGLVIYRWADGSSTDVTLVPR